jgi:hypothetical protein
MLASRLERDAGAARYRSHDDRESGGNLTPLAKTGFAPILKACNTILSIIDWIYDANAKLRQTPAEFRCQFPADPVLAAQIPLPAPSQILAQAIDIAGVLYSEQGILGVEFEFFPCWQGKVGAAVGLARAAKVAHIPRI